MKINVSIKPGNQIQSMYLFFIIASIQVGVGIIGAPRFIFLEAERGSWLAILIAFVYICLVLLCMFTILNQYENADFFGIHVDVFGKFIGKFIGSILLLYIAASFFSILMTYIRIIQLFLYHRIAGFLIALLIMILVLYAVFAGLKVVVGVSFILFLISLSLLSILYDSFAKVNWYNLLPLFETPLPDLLKGAKATSYTFSGFEILMIIYPFIQNKAKVKLPVFLAVAYNSFMLLLVSTLSIGFFTAETLKIIDWPVLILVKNASFAFMDRLDYIVVVMWVMVILPNLILLMWSLAYGAKRLYKIPQNATYWGVTIIILISVNLIFYEHHISKLTDIIARFGFWFIYVYPFILLPIVLLKKRLKKQKGE